ncbi:hypothetical protein T08_14082 [Trichinella sp. T8]|nr:hypothetical protein T08_14082 [Trichinella sp. T8]
MGSGRVWYNDMLVEGGDRAYYSESELELWWVTIPLSISGEKRGVRVYYSDQVVDLIRVADGGCRVCVAKGCPLYTELKDLLITRDEKWFIITEGKEQNSAATQRHNELRDRFATPPIATVLQLLGEDKL